VTTFAGLGKFGGFWRPGVRCLKVEREAGSCGGPEKQEEEEKGRIIGSLSKSGKEWTRLRGNGQDRRVPLGSKKAKGVYAGSGPDAIC